MPSSLPKNKLFFLVAVTTVACIILLPPPSTSFSLSPYSSSSLSFQNRCGCCQQHSSLVILHAKKKKKKNKTKPSNNKGFGNTNNQEPVVESEPAVSADVVARLNALYSLEADIENEEKQKDIVNSDLSESEEIRSSEAAEIKLDLTQEDESETTETAKNLNTADNDNKDDDDSEAANLSKRYMEEFEYQQRMAQNQKNKHQLVQLSSSPLIFTIDEFIDPEACRRVQNDATGCYDLMYPEKLSDNLYNGQESEMDGLLFNLASSKDHTTDDPYPDGLHMDTNNKCLNRHVTCILYLNDIPEECGGATVFPLSRTMSDDPVLQASQRLLNAKISHTRQKMPTKELQSDARLLETRLPVQDDFLENPDTSTAIRIQPKAGKLLVFFSRDENGQADPRAWHAGERIKPNGEDQATEKRILTLFKEVYYEEDNGKREETPLEDYLAPMVEEQRTWLKAKAKLQRALLEPSSS